MGVVQSNRKGPRSPRSTADTATTTEAPAEVDTFDPAGATVADVLAYVVEHPEQADAVLAAEQQGKARKGILDALA